MTPIRLVLILGAGLLFTDYKFGNGRLVDTLSDQAIHLGNKLNAEVRTPNCILH